MLSLFLYRFVFPLGFSYSGDPVSIQVIPVAFFVPDFGFPPFHLSAVPTFLLFTHPLPVAIFRRGYMRKPWLWWLSCLRRPKVVITLVNSPRSMKSDNFLSRGNQVTLFWMSQTGNFMSIGLFWSSVRQSSRPCCLRISKRKLPKKYHFRAKMQRK